MIRITLITLCLTGITLYPMDTTLLDTTQETYDYHVIITNHTTWPLIVLFTLKGSEEPAGLSLIPNGEVILEGPDSLETITVVPSGKVYGQLQWRSPQDLKALLTHCLDPGSRRHTFIKVLASASESLQYITPFTYQTAPLSHELLLEKLAVPESRMLINAFPEVKAVLTKNKIPFARRYLGISLSSTHIKDPLLSICQAFQRRSKRWQRHKKKYAIYAGKVLRLLEHAYNLLNEEHTIQELLKDSGVSLPLTLKAVISSGSDDEIALAETRLMEQWSDAPIETTLHTKVVAHLGSEYELLNGVAKLYEPVEEVTHSRLRRSRNDEKLLNFLLDPALLESK